MRTHYIYHKPNVFRNGCPMAYLVENESFDGDWHLKYFPDADCMDVYATSIWTHDSVLIDGVIVYWTYDLCCQGGYFMIYRTPEMTDDIIKKTKAHLRKTHDVVSLSVMKFNKLEIWKG